MPKIVINTNYHAAATVTLVDELIPRLEAAGHAVTRNDWEHYQSYDAAFFMSPDSEVHEAIAANPQLVTAVLDPKLVPGRRNAENAAADLLVVTSIEQRDALLALNDAIFVYYSFPNFTAGRKEHRKASPVIIGYHGNKEHLHCLAPTVTRALDSLSRHYQLEFWAMYNITRLGRWRRGLPRRIPVRHIQWSEQAYYDELAQADIGIANNAIPLNALAPWLSQLPGLPARLGGYPYRSNDYLVRYKYSTNPSRIYVFGMLGIPVVYDFSPSSSQLIRDGVNGYLAQGRAGWRWALEQLITQPQLRQTMGQQLQRTVQEDFSTEATFTRFNQRLVELIHTKHHGST